MAHRTTAPDSVAGLHVDRVPSVSPGTKGIAADRNMYQEEICSFVEAAGFTLDAADRMQLQKAGIAMSRRIGELFYLSGEDAPVIYSAARSQAHPAYPEYFPACPRWDADHDVTEAQTSAAVVAYFRGLKAKFRAVTDFTVSVSGSNVTFPNSAEGNAAVAALLADAKCSNWFNQNQTAASAAVADFATATSQRCITIANVDYVVTGADIATRIVTVTGSPASGSQTAILYPYRIAGQADRFRLHRIAGFVVAAVGDYDGYYGAGLRTMDAGQGHRHTTQGFNAGGGNNYLGATAGTGNQTPLLDVSDPKTDDTNGTPRTGKNTNPRALGGYPYTWLRTLIATLS